MWQALEDKTVIEKSAGQTLLENAYKLSTPADNAEYYDAFASTYDTDFADTLGPEGLHRTVLRRSDRR